MIHLDAAASCFNFIGGVILANDALRVRKNLKKRRGAEILVDTAKGNGDENLLYDSDNNPLRDHKAIEDWLSERTFRSGWIGFSFLVIGFGLDLISKFIS
jgi:hypothetical protein